MLKRGTSSEQKNVKKYGSADRRGENYVSQNELGKPDQISALLKKRRVISQQGRVILNTSTSTGLITGDSTAGRDVSARHMPKIGGKPHQDSRYDKNKSGRKAPTERKPIGLPKSNRPIRASADQGKKKPSKYVEEIIRMNLVAMVNRYEKHQAQKRRQMFL